MDWEEWKRDKRQNLVLGSGAVGGEKKKGGLERERESKK